MKTFWMAGLAAAALSLTALGQQRASAQCCPQQCQRGGDVTFNVGLTFGLHWTPKCGHWVPDCPTCGYPPPCYGYPPPPPPYGYRPFQPPQPTAVAAPNPPAAANPSKGPPAGLENVGYNYYAGYDPYYGYNYGGVYGIPYYQAPDYWYGR